jgi:CheY-like chemotaxis protein
MSPKSPLSRPLTVTLIEGEVVFLGEGAVNFSMTWDAALGTAQALAEALKGRDARPLPAVVLVVEDEAMIRADVAGALSDAGYHVIEAADAEEALGQLEKGLRIHLLFTDVQMPGEVDGLELARMVSVRWPKTPVLVCSGRVEIASHVLPPGGRFLHKPYDYSLMLRHVRELTAGA